LWFAFILWPTDICYTLPFRFLTAFELWFAFILWPTDICYTYNDIANELSIVVICFHSLTYWYLLHWLWQELAYLMRCDLLSFFDLLIFATLLAVGSVPKNVLWFAFILWPTDICYTHFLFIEHIGSVVICFHSLTYWYLLHSNSYFSFSSFVVICFHSLTYWYLLHSRK